MIYIGSDHRGYTLKEKVKFWLQEWNLEFEDMGNDHLDPGDDYPDFAKKVAEKLGEIGDKGIVICASGVGVDVCVNRHPKVRCGLGYALGQVKAARNDDAVVLAKFCYSIWFLFITFRVQPMNLRFDAFVCGRVFDGFQN